MYRDILVISLHTLTALLCLPGLYISSNVSSHVSFTRFRAEREKCLFTARVQSLPVFLFFHVTQLNVSWWKYSGHVQCCPAVKWSQNWSGGMVHICYFIWIFCGSFVLFAVKSLFYVTSFKNSPEYSDLYCIKAVFCFLRFLWECHHRWSNEDFLSHSTVVKWGNKQKHEFNTETCYMSKRQNSFLQRTVEVPEMFLCVICERHKNSARVATWNDKAWKMSLLM